MSEKKSETLQLKRSIAKSIVGQKIVAVQTVVDDKNDPLGYFTAPLVEIHLENGVGMYAQSDDEFNNVGIIVAIVPGKTEDDDKVHYLNYSGGK